MEESAATESKVVSSVEGDAKRSVEGGVDSNPPISKAVSKLSVEAGDDSTPISKYLLIKEAKAQPNVQGGDGGAGGDDYFSIMSRRFTAIPRIPAPYLVFMEQFLEPYAKARRTKNRSLVSVLAACGEKWTLMSDTDKKPFRAESARRMVVYNKHRASFDRVIYAMMPPPDSEFDDDEEPVQEIMSPFGIFIHCEVVLNGTRLTSFQRSLGEWNSMSSKEKAPFLNLSSYRMRIHELMSIEFFSSLLDQYRKCGGDDGEPPEDDSEGNVGDIQAANGLLVFLEEFMMLCDDDETELDPKKSGKLLVEEQVHKWYRMTEVEQGGYQAKANELMMIYDRRVFEACLRLQRA